MSISDYHTHGDLGDDDGLPANHRDDPRVGASPEEIAYFNKLEASQPRVPLDILVKTNPWLDTVETLA